MKNHSDPKDSKGPPQDSEGTNNLKRLGLFSVILGELIGYTGSGIAIGYWAWSKWGAPWWVLLLSSLAGLILAFYQLYKISQKEL